MPNGPRAGKKENRQRPRVSVQFRSNFSTKDRMVAGDGELKDLSPGGCRVASSVAAPVEPSWSSVSFLAMRATHSLSILQRFAGLGTKSSASRLPRCVPV